MDAWPNLSELTSQQYGRVSARQAQAAGMDRTVLSRLAARQQWERPYRGVYAAIGAADSPDGRLAAALLAVGPPVLVARWSAAWMWGLVRTAPTTPELVVPHQRRPGRQAGMNVGRSRTISVSDGVILRGLPVTRPARTLCDLAALTDTATLRSLLVDARQRRLVELPDVAACAGRMGTARGLSQLRRLVMELDGERCDSVLEYRLRRRLVAVPGLPQPAPHPVPVQTANRVLHVDIAWPHRLVGLEVDGFGSHSERRSLELDARRHNALQLAGWRVLRATWADLGEPGDALIAHLRALLQ